eukprot:GHVR01067222.1.p1 GENE.GHVR01067222.1~~GHVR01067222.1.p1  ORF type:complete len:166 (+),score=16.98 GHVR01067222.1:479-976(+)
MVCVTRIMVCVIMGVSPESIREGSWWSLAGGAENITRLLRAKQAGTIKLLQNTQKANTQLAEVSSSRLVTMAMLLEKTCKNISDTARRYVVLLPSNSGNSGATLSCRATYTTPRKTSTDKPKLEPWMCVAHASSDPNELETVFERYTLMCLFIFYVCVYSFFSLA